MTYLRIRMRKDQVTRLEVAPVNGVWHIRLKHTIEPIHAEATAQAALDWIEAQARNNFAFAPLLEPQKVRGS